MSAARAYLVKEVRELVRTWRLWLLLIPPLLFAIADPILVHFSPRILETAAGIYGDVEVRMADPEWIDVYRQWAGSLRSIFPLLLVLLSASTIAGECATGTAVPVLTGGLSRRNFVLIKFGVITGFAVLVLTITTLIMWAITYVIYPTASLGTALLLLGIAILLTMVLNALAILASTFMPDAISSVGLDFVVFLTLTAAALWHPAQKYSPAGLLHTLSAVAEGRTTWLLAPAISSIVVTVVLMWMAVRIFERREL